MKKSFITPEKSVDKHPFRVYNKDVPREGTERRVNTMNRTTDTEVAKMTNHQSDRMEILARIDELERLKETTDDERVIEKIKARLKELRERLATTT